MIVYYVNAFTAYRILYKVWRFKYKSIKNVTFHLLSIFYFTPPLVIELY